LSDEEGLIVARGKTAFVVMNLYPYNPGHLLCMRLSSCCRSD
jgi:ATP adenylyltransferase